MSTFIKNIIENKKILLILVVILLVASTIQSVFLVKLYRAVDRSNNTTVELSETLNGNSGLQKDFFKPFDLQNWDPYEEFQFMRDQMERMFDNSNNRLQLSPFFDEHRSQLGILPQTDLEEQDDRYVVTMNIPGSDKAEINVDLDGTILTVKAKTKSDSSQRNADNFLRMERSMGSFQRTLTLPGPVDASGMKTEYKDGVLTIIVPKPDQ